MEVDAYYRVVNAVKDYNEKYHKPPTVSEIMEAAGLNSTSHVLYHLMKAVELGDLVENGEHRTSRRYGVPQ